MRIASVIIPLFCNAGISLADVHADFRRDVCEAFGGFTAVDVTGAWRDESSGVIFEDSSVRYDIAADWNSAQTGLLHDIAESYCDKARQLSLYVCDAHGAVSFAEPAPAESDYVKERRDAKAWKRTRAAARAFKFAQRESIAA